MSLLLLLQTTAGGGGFTQQADLRDLNTLIVAHLVTLRNAAVNPTLDATTLFTQAQATTWSVLSSIYPDANTNYAASLTT